MMRPEFSCDRALGRMCNANINQSLCNLPSIKIDDVDSDKEDMGCGNVHKTNSLGRSGYKSVLPRKLGQFRAQVSQISPQGSLERLNFGVLKVNVLISKVRMYRWKFRKLRTY